VKTKDSCCIATNMAKSDLDRTGGANPPLSGLEDEVAVAMTDVFQLQFNLALDLDVVNTMDFAWVDSDTWADEIFKLTNGAFSIEAEASGVLAGDKLGIQLTDFIDRPQVQLAIREGTYQFANATGKSTANKLRKTLLDGAALGEDLDTLTKRVQAVFGFKDGENWRAKRIARTEMKRVNVDGERIAWRESGIVTGKEWDANNDSCPFCDEMNGMIVDLGIPYFAQGDELTVDFKGKDISLPFGYGSVQGPPLHPNCRCGLRPILIDDFENL